MDLKGVGPCWGIKAVKGRNVDMGTLATSMSQCSDKDVCRSSVVCWDGSLNMIICVCSVVSNSFVAPWTAGLQTSLFEDFPGKNTGVGCHFLLQGIFQTQWTEPTSLASPALAGRFFTTEPPGKPKDEDIPQ